MNEKDLVAAAAKTSGRTQREIARVLDAVLVELRRAVQEGEPVKLGGVGTLRPVQRKPRVGRHFGTGEPMAVEGRRAVRFVASSKLLAPAAYRRAHPYGWDRDRRREHAASL